MARIRKGSISSFKRRQSQDQKKISLEDLENALSHIEKQVLLVTQQKMEWRHRFYLLRDEVLEVLEELLPLLEKEGKVELVSRLAILEGLTKPCGER